MRTFLVLVLLSLPLHGQAPYLVKDINTTLSFDRGSSSPAQFTALGNRTFFVATTEAAGTELWSWDAAGGASMVADLLPGEASANPAALRPFGDTLLFNARDLNRGVEPFTTDGTAAGTQLLLDINPGPSSSDASLGIRHGGLWVFTADDGTHGRELWSTDGTAAGTRLVQDLEPGAASSVPRYFVAFRDAVYFVAGPASSSALWKTDGTAAGTVKVANVTARNLAVAGPRLFFEGVDAATGWEVWTSDGTEAGTQMLTEIHPGPVSAIANTLAQQGFTRAGDRMLFLATDGVHGRELWSTDGTAAGTRMVRDLTPGAAGTWDNGYAVLSVLGTRAWFGFDDGTHGHELWSTDGTDAGTSLFFEVTPGATPSFASPVGAIPGTLFFYAGSYGREGGRLWVTDGTASGTRPLRSAGGEPFGYDGARAVAGGRLYFAGSTALAGTEPWVSDGTDAGTRMLANLEPDGAPSSSPHLLAATRNLLFFHATEGTIASSGGPEASLWRTDGTAAGTFKLRETGQHPSPLTGAGDYVFFPGEESRLRLMLSDGTLEGTGPADAFLQRFDGAEIEKFFPFGDTLFVSAGDTLWKTTPTRYAPATRLGSRSPYGLVEVAGRHMFYAETAASIHDRGLWITDGTPGGTYAVIPDLGASYGDVSPLVNASGTVYFLARNRDEPAKLWKSDGTFDGTTVVKELPSAGTQVEIEAAGRRIFFLTHDALWTSDGTEAGTVELAEVELLSLGHEDLMKAVGDRVVFVQYDHDTNRYELWGSDGTPAGTKLLAQPYWSDVASIDGVAYFAGTDVEHGTELWTTDGTVEGTKLAFDLNAGKGSSAPVHFTRVGETLYFSAYGAAAGRELWALPLTAPRLSIADARAGETASAVRFTATLAGEAEQPVTVAYATGGGTATAGQDYEAASGTLTFAPGETAKTIDVRILGDAAPENNETFFLTLRDADGAKLVDAEAAGIVDDDDHAADLRATAELLGGSIGMTETVRVTNQGPRAATDVVVRVTSIPPAQDCWTCSIPQIANGASADSYVPEASGFRQSWRSAIVSARQGDPDPSDNAVSWTISAFQDLGMNAAFLTPGATATVTAEIISHLPFPAPLSSDPSVLSVSSEVVPREDEVATFTVTAHKPGTVTLTVGANRSNLVVTVVAQGTTPRWPDGLQLSTDFTAVRVHDPVMLTITPAATAPVTGATATGLVTVTANGQELARHNVTHSGTVAIPIYFRSLGAVVYQIAYAGDANFLPQTLERSVFVRQGQVAIAGLLERDPGAEGTYRLKVRVAGVPGAAPAGTLLVFHDGAYKAGLTLVPSADGTSTAETTLTGLPDSPTVSVHYQGNELYAPRSQEIRYVPPRRRNVRH